MKISISWLKELVNLKSSVEELVSILPLRSISTKAITDDFISQRDTRSVAMKSQAIIELDMKGYNRADLLSLRGVASEIAAVTGSKLLFKELEEGEFVWNNSNLPKTPVSIESEDLAQIQCVAKIEGLNFGKSSEELIKKLGESGMRPVNNVADVTNLVMLEYGQPLHAFDASSVEDETINVISAKNGEEITTLDGKLRKLDSSDIVLADTKKALDVAGVMGGKNTEVKESTNAILLSASLFNPEKVRKTSQRLGLQSEASKRFYHGLTKKRLLQTLDAAIRMYQSLGGKLTAINLVGNFEENPKKITLTKEKLESLVGISFEDSQVEDYLKRLYLTAEKIEGGWEVEVPYFRLDLNIEEDLIEEVARMYGYEKIPAEKVSESKALQKEVPIFKTITDLREKLVKLGLTEVQTYSFYTQDVLNALGFDESNQRFLVKVANPISKETEYLRMNIWPNLAEVTGRNIKRGFSDIAIFEVGKAFQPNNDGEPQEEYRLSIALSNNTDNPIEELISIANKLALKLKQSKPEGIGATLFHPKRFVAVEKEGKQIGGLSEIHLRVLDKLGINSRVAILELNIIALQ